MPPKLASFQDLGHLPIIHHSLSWRLDQSLNTTISVNLLMKIGGHTCCCCKEFFDILLETENKMQRRK